MNDCIISEKINKLMNIVLDELGWIPLIMGIIFYPLGFIMGACILAHLALHYWPW